MEYNIHFLTGDISNPVPFTSGDNIDDWVYELKLNNKWFKIYVENYKIKFDNAVFEKVKNYINSSDICDGVLFLSDLEMFKKKLYDKKLLISDGVCVPIIPNNEEEKLKHLDDEIKILKTKNSMLENKLKFYESEIALIKSTLGL